MEIIPQHPMAPLKEPKKSWFSYHHTATTVLIAVGILLIATALAWWQWPKSAEKPGQVTNQNQNPAQPDPTTSSDDQTYRSEKYGFEVMLPEDWVAESVGGSILFMSPEIKRDVDKYRISPPDFAYKNYDVRFTDHSQASQAVSATRTEIINNVSFKTFTTEGLGYAVYETKKDNSTYSFDSAEDSLLKQFLSTFKFISPPINTSDWQTWKTSLDHFTISIPKDWKIQQLDAGGASMVLIYKSQSDMTNGKTAVEIDIPLLTIRYDKNAGSSQATVDKVVNSFDKTPSQDQLSKAKIIP